MTPIFQLLAIKIYIYITLPLIANVIDNISRESLGCDKEGELTLTNTLSNETSKHPRVTRRTRFGKVSVKMTRDVIFVAHRLRAVHSVMIIICCLGYL